MLVKFRMHRQKSATERLYFHRANNGRGLINIFTMCRSEQNLRTYFINPTDPFLIQYFRADGNYTPLNLRGLIENVRRNGKELQNDCPNKILHGKRKPFPGD